MKIGVMFLLIVLLSYGAFASVQLDSENIRTNYVEGDFISGKIILNLSQINVNSKIISSTGGEISIIDLVNAHNFTEGIEFECQPNGCVDAYSTGQTIGNSFTLENEEEIGFKVNGKNINIKKIYLTLTGNAQEGCENQLKIDVPGSQEYLINSKYNNLSLCDMKNYGCFNSDSAGQNRLQILPEPGICERIALYESPAIAVGAKILNTTGVVRTIKMQVYSSALDLIGECYLPSLRTQEDELSCIVEGPIHDGDFFVCASAPAGNYKVRAESEGELCGTSDLGGEYGFDYEIFAQSYRYSSPLLNVSKDTKKQSSEFREIEDYVNDYIYSYYGDNDCSLGCIIPFEMKNLVSGSQIISIIEKGIEYATGNDLGDNQQIYKLNKEKAKISGIVEFDISKANFVLNRTGSYGVSLYLEDIKLLDNKIVNVTKGFSFSLITKNALIGIPSLLKISAPVNVSKVTWTIDENPSIDGETELVYTFLEAGNHDVTIRVISDKGIAVEKSFEIVAGNIEQSLSILKNKISSDLNRTKIFINDLPSWIKPIDDVLNVSDLERRFNSVINKINVSINDSAKLGLLNELNELNVPDEMYYGVIETLPFAIGLDNLNIDYIENISKLNIEDERRQELKEQIVYWNNLNYDSEIVRKEIVVSREDEEVIGSIYSININKKGDFSEKTYLMIDYPLEDIKFAGNYGQESIESEGTSATFIELNGNKIEFFIGEDIESEELGMYISPEISYLGNFEPSISIVKKLPLGWLWFWIILLIVVTFVLYIILQEWYKRHYENYLFRNKDDLYNLITFIFNSRKNGMTDNEIRRKLNSMGWDGEQITYAVRKLDGKRTGMWEIPIFRGSEKAKVNQEIEKRNKVMQNTRFIK